MPATAKVVASFHTHTPMTEIKGKKRKAGPSKEDKELGKAMVWARMNVSKTIVNWDFDEWKAFANEHKTEGTIWQLAAKFARIQDSEFYSFC